MSNSLFINGLFNLPRHHLILLELGSMTHGQLSCVVGPIVLLTEHRWIAGVETDTMNCYIMTNFFAIRYLCWFLFDYCLRVVSPFICENDLCSQNHLLIFS